ncbi:MAG: Gfo/Idh/MocA family oxidoreductase [Leptospirales bacterium]|nr:Gfo/Idh/MocA family oxidoreductase [Leptospirales bacterium]
MEKSKKKIALVGLGRVSRRHLEALEANKDFLEIAYVCDLDLERAKAVASKTGAKAINDFTAIGNVDFLSFATPSGLHPEHVKLAARACSAPWIICEKPIALTVREAITMYKEVESAGKTLLPIYQNRYNPLVAFMRDLIQSGKLGKMYQFVMNIYWNRNDEYFKVDWHGTLDLDGGVIFTQASHYVDMLQFFFGEVAEFHGIGGRQRGFETQDTVSAVLGFKDGPVGSLNATVSVYRENFMTEFTLIAEKGTVRISGTNLNTIDVWDVQGMNKPDLSFVTEHQYGRGHDTMYRLVADGNFASFPEKKEVLAGIGIMEKLSF